MFKKLNALILTFAMLIGCCIVFSAPDIVKAETEPDGLAYALHITEKKDANQAVTRGDAAGIVIRLLGYDADSIGVEQIFDDVSESHTNAAAIYTAAKLGIISGTEHSIYEPNENVTYEQFIKMVVIALGYEEMAEDLGGYPYGYTTVASRLDLDQSIVLENTEKLEVKTVSQIAENALHAIVFSGTNAIGEEGVTLLYKAFQLEQYSGVVTAIYGASYTPNSYADTEDDVYINDQRYKKGEESGVDDLLGCYVDFYVKEADTEMSTVVFAKKTAGREQEIDPQNVSQVSVDRNEMCISYYKSADSNRIETETLPLEKTSLVYNGFYTDITKSEEDLLDFSDGSIKLIDYNEDRVWDFLVIEQLTTVVVKTYSNTTQSLSFEYPVELGVVSTQTLDFTKYDTVIFEDDLSYSTLKLGDVLEIWLPKNDVFETKVIRLGVSDNIVRGELTEKKNVDKKCVVIDGQTYEFSDDYNAYAPSTFDNLQPGVEYTMYLTTSGKIAYIVNHLNEERVYGYLTNMAIGTFGSVTMKVLMEDGMFHTLDFADKVRVYRDGVDEGSKTPLQATEGFFVNGFFDKNQAQLIRFRPDRDSKVCVIEFAQNELGFDAAMEGHMDGKFIKSRSKFTGTYFNYSQIVYTDNGPEFPFPSTTVCFTVPSDPADFDDEKNFKVGGYTGQRNLVTVDTYNDDAAGVPEIIVRYGSVDVREEFPINSPIAVITDIVQCLDSEGELCDKMTDAMGNSYLAKAEDKVFVDQSTGEPLKRGDVVQVGTTKGGYVQFVDMIFFHDSDAPNGYGYTYTNPSTHARNMADMVIASGALDSERICASGYLTALTSEYIRIQNAAGEDAVFKCSGNNHYLFTVSERGDIVEERIDQANIGDYVVVRCTLSNLQEVVRYVD
ncbi:S-layer homology domain-containing protein [Ructibacterium gallinarum]|uniref:S-layer homology domain-containing protein n=1 Tax=Ructibacterium gallinarum TaxID=2779355 RepID=A0A9D5LYT2_9FIRM|nr:S-layer homology domain-containing protein [Ructibacterium gallinarum]MBE5039397.1 S-layer homology domain-containing protein [Ructibacterium gallinarum]